MDGYWKAMFAVLAILFAANDLVMCSVPGSDAAELCYQGHVFTRNLITGTMHQVLDHLHQPIDC